jgi:hypothetical protein
VSLSDVVKPSLSVAEILDPARCACSFCGKPRREVKKLVEAKAARVRICDECVWLCIEIMGDLS